MAILSKECTPGNSESHNSLKHSFTNIRGLCSNFVECEFFLESNSSDTLTLCELVSWVALLEMKFQGFLIDGLPTIIQV